MVPLMQNYTDWLTRETVMVAATGAWTQLVTPYLKFNNDPIEVFFRRDPNDQITYSDDQQTLRELEMIGLTLDDASFGTLVERVLRAHGVHRVGEELTLTAAINNKEIALHRFLETLRNLLDLHVLVRNGNDGTTPPSEDFDSWLRSKDIPFLRNPTFYGESGLTNTFDFAVPAANGNPEQLIRIISNPGKEQLIGAITIIQDTLSARPESQGLVVLNDREELKAEVLETLSAYRIPHVKRSDQERILQLLRPAA